MFSARSRALPTARRIGSPSHREIVQRGVSSGWLAGWLAGVRQTHTCQQHEGRGRNLEGDIYPPRLISDSADNERRDELLHVGVLIYRLVECSRLGSRAMENYCRVLHCTVSRRAIGGESLVTRLTLDISWIQGNTFKDSRRELWRPYTSSLDTCKS